MFQGKEQKGKVSKMEKKINVISAIIAIVILLVTVAPLQAQALTNKQIAKRYAKTHYTECKVKFFRHYDAEKIENRKGTKVVWIWKIYSKSNGNRYGTCEDGSIIAYNKKVKKGKRVVSYCIYNPYTNYCDDIVAVVDNKIVR